MTCRIFRRRFFKLNGGRINPHLNNNICDDLRAKNLVYYRKKQFLIDANNKTLISDNI